MKYVYLLFVYIPHHHDYKNGFLISGHYANRPLVFNSIQLARDYKLKHKIVGYIRWVKLREN